MRVTRDRTKRPRGALLQLGIGTGLRIRRIGGSLGSSPRGEGGGNGEIPLFRGSVSNRLSEIGTVSGGQFDWGGRLPNGNGGAQRCPQAGWKSAVECKGRSRALDCETDRSSRDESRA